MNEELITPDNYEEYLYLSADGELDEAQQQALQRFLSQHPGLEAELADLTSLKLEPDAAIVFGPKHSLLKEEPRPRTIALNSRRMWAAAALALLVSASLSIGIHRLPNDVGSLARLLPVPALPMIHQTPAAIQVCKVLPAIVAHLPHSHFKRPTTRQAVTITGRVQDIAALAPLQPAEHPAPHSISTIAHTVLLMAEMPADKGLAAQQEKPVNKKICIAAENIAALETLKDAAKTTLDRVANSPYFLRNAAFSVKLSDRKISINF